MRCPSMDLKLGLDVSSVLNLVCWGICFWWMHTLSKRQETMLQRLQDQAKRIERVSSEEHELLKEVHPAVAEIQHEVTHRHPAD